MVKADVKPICICFFDTDLNHQLFSNVMVFIEFQSNIK